MPLEGTIHHTLPFEPLVCIIIKFITRWYRKAETEWVYSVLD